MSTTIAITGGSGNMGQEVIGELLSSNADIKLRLLLLNTRKDRAFARKITRKNSGKVKIIYGDIQNFSDCEKLMINANYLIHMAAIIPPLADHDYELTKKTNYDGTVNLVKATLATGNTAKFIHISSVAIYGNRNMAHPYGRVGDPVMPSVFDIYGATKAMSERYVLESDLKTFVVLRQTGILHKDILIKNISDGLLFHTPWNVPIEWVTSKDSGVLLRHIIEYDLKNQVPAFWKKIYNIGGGAGARETGYETFDNGFKIINGSTKTFFKPEYNQTGNFHCFWFLDSEALLNTFDVTPTSTCEFWAEFKKTHKIYALAKLIPSKVIRKFAIERLYKNDNSPYYWIEHDDKARIIANYGSMCDFNRLPRLWENESLVSEQSNYNAIKLDKTKLLPHGFNEDKPMDEIDIDDLRNVAKFRGGELISNNYKKGDMYTKLMWKCHEGHTFYLTPYSVLFGGFWCDKCCMPDNIWEYDKIVKGVPFYQTVYYDSHRMGENYTYKIDGKKFLVF